jgi:hypothetical protein
MSQRDSGYERKERDLYETPAWVTEALLPHIPLPGISIWEPACGSGKMVRALEAAGHVVTGTDVETGGDFFDDLTVMRVVGRDWIITNPPYKEAHSFISHALFLASNVAMLLRTDFDHAKTRTFLFGGCKQFSKKVVLTKRIRWFEDSKGSPSFNHAWFIWRNEHQGPPTLAYGP